MAEYTTTAGDQKYRRVNLSSDTLEAFMPISKAGTVIQFGRQDRANDTGSDTVLEVVSEDGSRKILASEPRKKLACSVQGDVVLLDKCPTEHLWVRANDSETLYKVPRQLPSEGSNLVIRIPGASGGIEFCGDEYFNAVYSF